MFILKVAQTTILGRRKEEEFGDKLFNFKYKQRFITFNFIEYGYKKCHVVMSSHAVTLDHLKFQLLLNIDKTTILLFLFKIIFYLIFSDLIA